MRYRIWNATVRRWVKNDDGHIAEFDNEDQAAEAITKLNDLKKLNLNHCHDIFVASAIHEPNQ